MKKKTIKNKMLTYLKERIAFGDSKHIDKIENNLKWGESTYKIYSYSTYNTYKKVINEFCNYLKENNINNYIEISDTEKYAVDYINMRKERNISVYTLKMERSAFGMLYKHTLDVKLPARRINNIKRSREFVENDRHYSQTGKYKDLFTILKSTGCRRCDIIDLKKSDFFEKDGELYLNVKQSKGGRDRVVVVLNKNDVKDILDKKNDNDKLFDKVPKKIDVHSYRRQYCKDLYKLVSSDIKLKEKYLKEYPLRNEKVKKDTYTDRETKQTFDRDCVYICTQSLGHNRLNVTVNHYLT